MSLFTRFAINEGEISCSDYLKGKIVEKRGFIIDLFHFQLLINCPNFIDESSEWSHIKKFNNNSIMDFDLVVLRFTTHIGFDSELIPKRILIFTDLYSDENKFQIQNYHMEPFIGWD